MVLGVIGLAGVLLDDESFCVAPAAGNPSVDVVLFIASARQPAFPILKDPATDVAGKRLAVPPLERLQQCVSLVRRRTFNPRRRRGNFPVRQGRNGRLYLCRCRLDGVRPSLRGTGDRCDGPKSAARRENSQAGQSTT